MLPTSLQGDYGVSIQSLPQFTSKFVKALASALDLGRSNAKKVRTFVGLIVRLPYEASFDDSKKEYPLYRYGDDYMRAIIEQPTGFKPEYARLIVQYLDTSVLESRLRSLMPAKRQKLLEDLRAIESNVGKFSLEEWVCDTVAHILGQSAEDETALSDALVRVSFARAERAKQDYKEPLLADSSGLCSIPQCHKPLRVVSDEDYLVDAEVITIDPHSDPASPANLLLVCHDCALTYGKNPSIEKIEQAKRTRLQQQQLHHVNLTLAKRDVEDEIAGLIRGLPEVAEEVLNGEIRAPLRIEQKLPQVSFRMLHRKVLQNVTVYFTFIETQFKNNEAIRPGGFDAFSRTVADLFDRLDQAGESREEIFTHLVDWLSEHSTSSREASEAVISYFVQNCEVFR